jgi:hypothetical protein
VSGHIHHRTSVCTLLMSFVSDWKPAGLVYLDLGAFAGVIFSTDLCFLADTGEAIAGFRRNTACHCEPISVQTVDPLAEAALLIAP